MARRRGPLGGRALLLQHADVPGQPLVKEIDYQPDSRRMPHPFVGHQPHLPVVIVARRDAPHEVRLRALHTGTGEELWAIDAPAMTACGPSVVDGRLLWGYGFMLFGDPGPGGLLCLEVGAA